MDAEEFEAALNELVAEFEGDLGDRHAAYLRFKQMLDQMRAMGMPLPSDFAAMEAELDEEFAEEAQGKTS